MRTATAANQATHAGRRLALGLAVVCLTGLGFAAPAAAAVETGAITGTFRTPAGGPIGGARVQAINAFTGYPEAATTTGQDGTYTVAVRAGAFQLRFVERDGTEQYAPQQTKLRHAAAYPVTVGATVTVNETRIARGTIAGRLVDAAGAPAAGSDLTLYPAGEDEEPAYAATTAADGTFQTRAPAGRYRMSFTLPSNRNAEQFVPRKLRLADAANINVTADRTTTVNERLLRTGFISGRVLTADRQPLSAYVSVYPVDGEATGTAVTDANGSFRLEVFPGRYRIGFYWENFSRVQYFTGSETLDKATVYCAEAGRVLSVVDRVRSAAVR